MVASAESRAPGPELTLEHFRARLAGVYDAQRALRAEAFVRYTPIIAGQRCATITLERYNHLVAFRSPFVCGGQIHLEDLLVFLWILHPRFGQFDHPARRACYREALRALQPRRPLRSALAHVLVPLLRARRGVAAAALARLLRWWIEPSGDELILAAIAEAKRLAFEAVGEFPAARQPSAGRDDGVDEPAPYPVQAQVLNLLRRELGIPFAEARSMPMKELCQHLRELLHHGGMARAALMTPDEAAVWRDYEAWRDARPT